MRSRGCPPNDGARSMSSAANFVAAKVLRSTTPRKLWTVRKQQKSDATNAEWRRECKNISSASERPNTAPPPSQNDTKSVSPAGGGAEPLCHRLVLRRRSTFSILLVAARTAASPTPAHATNKGVTPVTGMASSAPPQIAAMATATPWSTSVFLFTRCGSSAVVA
jgi:hypothetical protein